MNVELLVMLKVPDTTAITAQRVLERMGIDAGKVHRADYYLFDIGGNEKEFAGKIVKVDVIVNSNKNTAQIGLSGKPKGTSVLVKDSDDECEGLLHVLTQRLGMREIKKIRRGVLWTMECDRETAKGAAEQLLCNRHYQDYKIL
ncbi:hypothetical protein HY638_04305 [Candidatus Woesearchaeota archaeon]|nr:hypothetical protein [Candidatus Woesearchaeota archaeon]